VKLLGLVSYAVVPLLAGEKAFGVIAVDYVKEQRSFPKERLNSLIAFANISALAIENSLLYTNLENYNRTLEQKVAERTQELSRTLENLKSTQAQLVQSEKMASLGQLTAGIAHEINNPINFVSSNIKPLKRDIAELLEIAFKYVDFINKNHLNEKFCRDE